MDPLVTIIIPVYNAEKHIEECIRSLMTQTLEQIQVIVVNDGSIDGTAPILRKLSSADRRVTCIDTSNKGVSRARNLGLEAALGKFICFMDADDWAEPVMIERLYTGIVSAGADLGVCNVNLQTEYGTTKPRLSLSDVSVIDVSDKGSMLADFLDYRYDFANWNKIYRSDIIRSKKICFHEEMKIWEDLLFNLHYLLFVEKIYVTGECLYNYRIHSASTMFNPNKDLISNYNLLYSNFENVLALNEKAGLSDIFRQKMTAGCYNYLIPEIAKQVRLNTSSFSEFVVTFSKELARIYKGFFSFNAEELKGFQGFKKRLLVNGKFSHFARIVAVRELVVRENFLLI
jgi:glycosyltransferase involved in cell wall biosynthesis